ncbi:hypothetical protein G9F31_02450 [Acinetobacter sp. 187]|uniref:Transposase n=1 Tax=Acinetobacter lanii TaxID=2715163 RepID=A0A6G8S4E8_9GAMM|nr:hypothetical protein [Acinetobacter lanii]NHC02634.1 hypothetical protein [Acinetobacter lanii]QIO09096.1 hypothetical protein G8D99_08740 [Acinetobacter lanii]
MNKIENVIAKSVNGSEILVSLVPSQKMQSTRDGFKWVEVGKKVLLQSGLEIELNLDGRSFYTGLHEMFRLEKRAC